MSRRRSPLWQCCSRQRHLRSDNRKVHGNSGAISCPSIKPLNEYVRRLLSFLLHFSLPRFILLSQFRELGDWRQEGKWTGGNGIIGNSVYTGLWMHFLQVDGLLNWFPKLTVYTSSGGAVKMYILMLWDWSGAWDSAFLVIAQVLLLPWDCPSNSKAIKDFNPLESESSVCVSHSVVSYSLWPQGL